MNKILCLIDLRIMNKCGYDLFVKELDRKKAKNKKCNK